VSAVGFDEGGLELGEGVSCRFALDAVLEGVALHRDDLLKEGGREGGREG